MTVKQHVIAEVVDHRDGKRYFPGDVFPDAHPKHIERLTDAGCLSTEKPDLKAIADERAAAPDPTIAFDEIAGMNSVPALRKLAKGEGIDLGDAKTLVAIRAAIRAARAAKAG